MRSDLIFGALAHVTNRYTLCQLASKATRKLHKPTTRIEDTTNEVFVRFHHESPAASMVFTTRVTKKGLREPSQLTKGKLPIRITTVAISGVFMFFRTNVFNSVVGIILFLTSRVAIGRHPGWPRAQSSRVSGQFRGPPVTSRAGCGSITTSHTKMTFSSTE